MQCNYHLDKNFISNPKRFGNVDMYQIGRMYCSKETVVATHVHMDVYELTIVTDGKGVITTNGCEVAVEKGDIYMSLPGDRHAIRSDEKNPLKFDFFAFNSDEPNFHRELEALAENYYSAHTRTFHDERIRGLVSNAIAELCRESLYVDELLKAILCQIVIYVIRGFREIAKEEYADSVSEAEILCYKMMNYIDTHIYSMKYLEELSGIMGYSYGYLSATFRKTTSATLTAYFQEKKLDTARFLIRQNEFKIIEIAEMLNYSSVYAFSKAFSKRYGMSPRHYRNFI